MSSSVYIHDEPRLAISGPDGDAFGRGNSAYEPRRRTDSPSQSTCSRMTASRVAHTSEGRPTPAAPERALTFMAATMRPILTRESQAGLLLQSSTPACVGAARRAGVLPLPSDTRTPAETIMAKPALLMTGQMMPL